MSKVLHLHSRSSSQGDGLAQCLEYVAPGDGVVLLEEAVVEALASSAVMSKLERTEVAVFVLETHLRQRGLHRFELGSGVSCMDFSRLVHLVVEFDLSQTWS